MFHFEGTFTPPGARRTRRAYLEDDSELSENDSSENSRASDDSHGENMFLLFNLTTCVVDVHVQDICEPC